MNDTIPKRRAQCVCVHEGKILLVHRVNKLNNREYFIFPGDIVEDDESIEDALVEETEGETSVKVALQELFYTEEENQDGEEELYYICEYLYGEPALKEGTRTAVEHAEGEQLYTPMWVPLEILDDLIVYPEVVKNLILETYSQSGER